MAAIETAGLVEQPELWELPIAGRTVTRCMVDSAFGIELWSQGASFSFRIENVFRLEGGGEPLELSPATPRELGPALEVLGKIVTSARAYKDGRLEIRFQGDLSLSVEPDPAYEAWEFVGGRLRLVALPGGELAVWR